MQPTNSSWNPLLFCSQVSQWLLFPFLDRWIFWVSSILHSRSFPEFQVKTEWAENDKVL
jgi:hypothetical protein